MAVGPSAGEGSSGSLKTASPQRRVVGGSKSAAELTSCWWSREPLGFGNVGPVHLRLGFRACEAWLRFSPETAESQPHARRHPRGEGAGLPRLVPEVTRQLCCRIRASVE